MGKLKFRVGEEVLFVGLADGSVRRDPPGWIEPSMRPMIGKHFVISSTFYSEELGLGIYDLKSSDSVPGDFYIFSYSEKWLEKKRSVGILEGVLVK